MRKTRHESTPGNARFTLWREVVVAYTAPTLIAGFGGLISGQASLLVSAFTSIGISSAVVAALIGAWLQRRGISHTWLRSGPQLAQAERHEDGPAVLVRPDGYIAWAGTDDGWRTALRAWTGSHQRSEISA